jgi:two-component system NtrC family response regulator
MAKVLIIDDEELMGKMLSALVVSQGHQAHCASTLANGLRQASEKDFDIIFLDVRLPDGNGLDAIPRLRALPAAPEIIIITSHSDPDGAELAITRGAWDYIHKTSSMSQITLPLARALQYRQAKQALKQPMALKLEGIVGGSPPMQACLDLLAQAAASDANVLLTGATGTGK